MVDVCTDSVATGYLYKHLSMSLLQLTHRILELVLSGQTLARFVCPRTEKAVLRACRCVAKKSLSEA